ncbi:MAG: type IX secretion system sortase PorU [Tannerella sp.]|jgi:hypothetical protein|nr:type IX secretion system sortase PorU [Tannerella sp.]
MNRIYIILLFNLLVFAAWADTSRYAVKSALAEGRWVKIQIDKTGIYKLTYAELRKMGFADPAKVSVHGYGGWILDEDFSKLTYIDDVPATAVWRGNDYLLFYGKGPVKWSYGKDPHQSYYDNYGNQFVHENNPYSMYGYYFVTDATETNEIKTAAAASGATLEVQTFDDFQVHEKDQISVKQSGRDLFGESFEGRTSQDFTFQVPGITDDEGLVTLRFISGSAGSVSLSVDNSALFINADIRDPSDEYEKGVALFRPAPWSGAKSEQPKVTVSYSLSNKSNVFLDYIRIQMKRKLQSYGESCTFFRSLDAQGKPARFLIDNASSDMMVFDVTDGVNPVLMETTLNGSVLSFSIPADQTLREFALVDLSKSFPVPERVAGEVQAQNLHGLAQQDMIILAQPDFAGEAKRLAEHHRTHTKLKVEVITPEQVYNEFSSGTPDATAIRRFMKMFYDRRSSEADAPRFLLLFGDGSYDNRQLTNIWKSISMKNFLLTYQTHNSLNAGSYVVDDYFGLLADNQGSEPYSDQMLLGIGRFPVRTVAEARAAVDKVIDYALNRHTGSWKNRLCFVADDGANKDNTPLKHMQDANIYADSIIEKNHPAYMSGKLFFDAYKKTSVGGKVGYPDIEENIKMQLKEGVLVINYVGHGNPTSWSDEQVLTNAQIQNFNYTNLPLWITATCDFAPFDASTTSAGENVFLNAKSGGIALFTTTRVAYAGPNYSINTAILTHLFDQKEGRRLTLGEVLREMKKDCEGSYRMGFTLLGDPALTLTYPQYELKITEINGQPAGKNIIAFKALEKLTVKGEVYDENGNKATGFNGMLSATVMDSQEAVTTLDNNGYGKFTYNDFRSVLQKVNEEVRNGEFTFSFVVPSFISYSGQPGKISLYASDESAKIEANGAFKQFTVGGTAPDPETDSEGPEIRALYLNDTTFTEGGKVNDTPFFVARLWDKSGVYIGGSSIGHDMTLTIDNNPQYSFNMNACYETLSGGQEGLVKFPVSALPEGMHTAEFKVFDVMANSTTRTFTFEVVKGLKPFIFDLLAAPSPARQHVTFMLSHNRPESEMNVQIRVYNMMGQIEWEHAESGSSELFKTYNVTWNLTNSRGVRLRPGIYIYRAGIRTGTSSEATKAKKLVILGH